jgi:NAD(P)-dependent dehydrogenase (short-subunit alcohol dehydrogenase family)
VPGFIGAVLGMRLVPERNRRQIVIRPQPTGGIMTTASAVPASQREPGLPGQTVVVIGGSSGMGLETARQARGEGAGVILAGRNPDRLAKAAAELGALSSAAFDATDPAALGRFFDGLPEVIDHVMVTGPGPYYAPLADLDRERAHRDFDDHLWLAITVAQHAVGRVRPGGTLLFMAGTGGRSRGPGLSLVGAGTAALPALVANLAVEVAPIRVNLIAAGFVDTPLSASLLGGDLDKRRAELRATLPIRRVVEPADIAALAVHLMINTAVTGATYDIDGGEQLLPGG